MGGKVEKDIWGCVAVLADAFGDNDNPAIQEAAAQARKYAGMVPEAQEKKTDPKEVSLVYCEACQVHHVEGSHSTTETIPAAPPPPVKTSSGPDLYCVYDRNCCFLRPFRSPHDAMREAKLAGGYVRVVTASDLPEEGAKDGAR